MDWRNPLFWLFQTSNKRFKDLGRKTIIHAFSRDFFLNWWEFEIRVLDSTILTGMSFVTSEKFFFSRFLSTLQLWQKKLFVNNLGVKQTKVPQWGFLNTESWIQRTFKHATSKKKSWKSIVTNSEELSSQISAFRSHCLPSNTSPFGLGKIDWGRNVCFASWTPCSSRMTGFSQKLDNG